MKTEAIFFDLFNTLVLLKEDHVFYTPSLKKLHKFLAKNGVRLRFEEFERIYFEVRDELYASSQKSLEEPHFNVRVSKVLRRFGYDFGVSHPVVRGATEAFCAEFMRYARLDPDVIYVLRQLRKKYKLGIVSNFAMPECAERLMENLDLKRFFDVVVISATVNKRKPSPDIFRRALNEMGVEVGQAVFVGDTPSIDVKGAQSVGIRSVLIQRETPGPTDSTIVDGPSQIDTDVKPDRIIDSLRDLLDILEDC